MCYKLISISLLLVVTVDSYCPPGFVNNNTDTNSTEHCVCGSRLDGILDCDQKKGLAKLAIGFCIHYNFSTNSTLVGRCQYNSNYTLSKHGTTLRYVTLPDSVHKLNEFQCGMYNRSGILCNHCHHHFESSMLSYSLKCIPCEHAYYKLGRFIYIMMSFLLVTVLYILIILFDIAFNESPWSVFVLYSQVVVNMLTYDRQLYLQLLYVTNGNLFTELLVKMALAFYGIWNLDFIPNILPSFCLFMPKSGRHEFLMEYFVALYPPFLIVVLYLCVHLHSRNVKLIVLMWKAVKKCLTYKICCGLKKIGQRITTQTIANSFSSFLVLTFSKVIFLSLNILLPVRLYNLDSTDKNMYTVRYFGPDYHYTSNKLMPFMICASTMVCLFTIFPTLLIMLYPTFSRCCDGSLVAIKLFVENFNGWYRDGTEGGHDFRVLASLHPILRIMLAISIALHISYVRPDSLLADNQWLLFGFIFILLAVFFIIAKPYKVQYMNQVEALCYILLGTILLLLRSHFGSYFAFTLGTLPMFLVVGYCIKHTCKKLITCYRQWKTSASDNITVLGIGHSIPDTEDFTADRLENPTDYVGESSCLNNDSVCVNIPTKLTDYGTF